MEKSLALSVNHHMTIKIIKLITGFPSSLGGFHGFHCCSCETILTPCKQTVKHHLEVKAFSRVFPLSQLFPDYETPTLCTCWLCLSPNFRITHNAALRSERGKSSHSSSAKQSRNTMNIISFTSKSYCSLNWDNTCFKLIYKLFIQPMQLNKMRGSLLCPPSATC